jgi:hypothetical protein
MADFPRTEIGGLSVSRLIMGTNWFLGFSHTTHAKDELIKATQTSSRIADIMEVFVKEGVDTLLGMRPDPTMINAVKETEQRTGRKIITLGTPGFPVDGEPPDWDAIARMMDDYRKVGCSVLMPHQGTTDALLDRRTHTIRHMERICAMIRERGMRPGLSTHMPETVPYADAADLDITTYIQIYNAVGFLMQVEVDWVHRIIQRAKHPVLTIKPLAAGRLLPLVGLAFAWSTIRDQDMISIGCYTPDEAAEVIEISRSLLERRESRVQLQHTRSKTSLAASGK